MSPPAGTTQGIDRMVAIGRTAMAHDLSYLRVDRSFAQVTQRTRSSEDTRGNRDIDGELPSNVAPIDHWTAAQIVIKTDRA
jgi:hypothetical protein